VAVLPHPCYNSVVLLLLDVRSDARSMARQNVIYTAVGAKRLIGLILPMYKELREF
jgi:hypothetical protein